MEKKGTFALCCFLFLFLSICTLNLIRGPSTIFKSPIIKARLSLNTSEWFQGRYEKAQEEATTEATSTQSTKHDCYLQVQIWRGSNKPQKPQVSSCPGLKCGIHFVEDSSFETMEKSDAVVLFHRSGWDWEEMRRRRPVGQSWVFYSMESPRHTSGHVIPPPSFKENPYNYTVTYRPSSTVGAAYGYYNNKKPEIHSEEMINWAQNKSRLVAWAASNCGTSSWKRFQFVLALGNQIHVDRYGGCGTLKCNRGSRECWRHMRTYKFYLALENSECRDYITEKFWRNSLHHGIVPIVYGTKREDYELVGPPNSFIHLQDFNSMTELVDYINLVDSNDTLYNSYLAWKHQGSVIPLDEDYSLSAENMCGIVKKIINKEKMEMPNLNEWWTQTCMSVSGFPHDF